MVYSIQLTATSRYLRTVSNIAIVLLFVSSVACASEMNNFTIFSAMRSIAQLDPIENQIQMNSIWSWSRLVPLENILLFFDDIDSCAIVHTHYPNISCRMFSPPECFNPVYNRSLIRCAFELAQKHARTSILLFVNGDIMLDQSISRSISFVGSRLPEFFVVGCSRDYEIASSMVDAAPENILRAASINSRQLSTVGSDLIAFRTSIHIRMPPFLIGVSRWDNWLLSEIILRTNITLVDVTQSVLAIHQQAKRSERVESMPDSLQTGALYNDGLARNASGVDYKIGFIYNADQMLVGNCRKGECSLKSNLHRSKQVLIMQRANTNKYIAVLTVSTGYISMAWNWICWAKRIAFRNYILLAEDLESYETLRAANEPVYISYNQSLITKSKSEAKYGSIEFQVTMLYRVEFLMSVLRAGYHFLNADMDSIWLSDPFDHMTRDQTITIQGQMHKLTKMSGGLVLVHATPEGRKFWQSVIECQKHNLFLLQHRNGSDRKRPSSDFTEQECINNQLNTTKAHLLDPHKFPDGRAFFDLQVPQRRGVVPVVIHGNWVVGLDAKLDRLKAWNLLASKTKVCSPLETGLLYSSAVKKTPIQLRIRVLTQNRLESLKRLLTSLLAADYMGDSIALDISIDRPSPEASIVEQNKWQAVMTYMSGSVNGSPGFSWPHGPLAVIARTKHIGLLGQWTSSSNHREIQLVLEDDLVVSPYFYIFVKRAVDFYYYNKSNYDGRLFGLSLQHPHTILGETTGIGFRSIEDRLNETEDSTFYKYQLLGTWGAVLFPSHWRAFLQWMATVRLDDMKTACTPNLLLTKWWIERYRTGRVWEPWFVRFVFEKGWYSLYTNFPNHESFAINYREKGLNFNTTRGPMNSLVQQFQPSVHLNFTQTPLVFDYHFNRIQQPDLLGIRSNLWHRHFFSNQCFIVEKDNSSKTGAALALLRSSVKSGTAVPINLVKHQTHTDEDLRAKLVVNDLSPPLTKELALFLLSLPVAISSSSALIIVVIFLAKRRRRSCKRIIKKIKV